NTLDIFYLSIHDALPILSVKGEVVSDSVSAGSAGDVLQVIVDRVTENLAQRYTQPGELLAGDLLIEVADVASLKDYAALSQYLRSEEHTSELQSRENLVC